MTITTTTTSPAKSAKETEPSNAPAVIELGGDLSPAVKAIETAYRMIQRRFRDLPDVTIVIQRDRFAWGHTTVAKTWAAAGAVETDPTATRFELMISGENLRRGAVAVFATLLHEAAHAANLQQGVFDTDTSGRHNLKFRDRAMMHGLTVEQAEVGSPMRRLGFTITTISEDAQQSWKHAIGTIARGLGKAAVAGDASVAHLGIEVPKPPKIAPVAPVAPVEGGPVAPRKRGNRNLAVGTCGCGRKLRASIGVLEDCQPTCQLCGEVFAVAA